MSQRISDDQWYLFSGCSYGNQYIIKLFYRIKLLQTLPVIEGTIFVLAAKAKVEARIEKIINKAFD